MTQRTLTPDQSIELEKRFAKLRKASDKRLTRKIAEAESFFYRHLDITEEMDKNKRERDKLFADNAEFIAKCGNLGHILLGKHALKQHGWWDIYQHPFKQPRTIEGTYEQVCLYAATLPDLTSASGFEIIRPTPDDKIPIKLP
jgi:hypothetical protein